MRCSLGSIPLYSGRDPSLVYIQPSAFSSLVNPDGSNIRLRQHLKFRPFWLTRRCCLQMFESPKSIRRRKWPVGMVTISISCYQQSLSVYNFGAKGRHCPPLCCSSQVQRERNRKRSIKNVEGNWGSREEAERVGCGRTRKKQEKAKAVKVSKYKIKCVCSSLMGFLFFLALPCCSLESFKEKQCNFKYHAFFWSSPLINILRWSRQERELMSWLTESTILEVEV